MLYTLEYKNISSKDEGQQGYIILNDDRIYNSSDIDILDFVSSPIYYNFNTIKFLHNKIQIIDYNYYINYPTDKEYVWEYHLKIKEL